jgi:signal peptide peptidase SppA
MPYTNEHSCRLRDPGDFQSDSFRRMSRDSNGKQYDVIMGKLKGEDTMTDQAYRYPKDTWTEAEARTHCKEHDGILFEPASGNSEGQAAIGEEPCCGENQNKGRQMSRSYILTAFLEAPWAILPYKLAVLEEIVARHVAGEKLDAEEIQTRIHGAKRPAGRRAGSVAVLPLFGTIFPRANMMTDISGATSAERFGAQFDELIMDPDVGAIVLDVDSPGGMAAGVEELSQKIYGARGQKPIVAVANYEMDSAAYWIGSSADEVVITPSGELGSIGVWAAHDDISGALSQEGIKRTLISEGKYKVEGNPWEPLTEEARSAIQASVREVYDVFIRDVARNRGVKPAAVRNGFGEGRVVGARQAVELGMADQIGTLEETIKRLRRDLFRLSDEGKQQMEEAHEMALSALKKQHETNMVREEVEEIMQMVDWLRKKFYNLPPQERIKDMNDLKPFYDAVMSAEEEVQQLAKQISDLYAEGSDESKAKILDIKPQLDAALKKKDEAVTLYESMQKANRPNDVAKNFIPISNTSPEDAESRQPTVIKRADYDALSLVDRAKFIRSGGTVED